MKTNNKATALKLKSNLFAALLLSALSLSAAARDRVILPSEFDTEPAMISSSKRKSSKLDIDAKIETEIQRSLGDEGGCVESKSVQKVGLTVKPAKVTLKTVKLKNCAPLLLQKELKASLGSCTPNEKDISVSQKLRHERDGFVSIDANCLCTQVLGDYHHKLTFNPLRTFEGAPSMQYREVRGCSVGQLLDLIASQSDRAKAFEAFTKVEDQVSEEN
jgi:hypothetical protein